MHHPGSVCPGCGGTRFSQLGEDVTEVLEKIPARLKVIRHIRPKLSCRCCERIMQAPMPDLPIEKGRPGPGLVANVVVSKYLDGLPLYRQSASSIGSKPRSPASRPKPGWQRGRTVPWRSSTVCATG